MRIEKKGELEKGELDREARRGNPGVKAAASESVSALSASKGYE